MSSSGANLSGIYARLAAANTFTQAQTVTANTVIKGPRPWIDVSAFGDIFSGGDVSAIFNAALATGKNVMVPEGTYQIDAALTPIVGQRIRAHGAKIQSAVANTLLTLAEGVEVEGLEIQGPGGAAVYAGAHALVNVAGTAAAYKAHMVLRDCYLHGSGAYLVLAQYVSDLELDNVRMYDAAYAAVGILSGTRVRVGDCDIDMNTPAGSAGNAYGVFFSRTQGTLAAEPYSQDCEVRDTLVRNNPLWEAFDTHGGQRCNFYGITALNCHVGVAIGTSKDGAGVTTFAPHNCHVDGYTIDSQVTDGSAGFGITVGGVTGGEKARGCGVGVGTVIGHGSENVGTVGGIAFNDTIGFNLAGAICVECSSASVIARGSNSEFQVSFVSIDPWGTAFTTPRHFYVNGGSNTGTIGPYVFGVGTKVAQYVSVEGIRVDNTAGNALAVSIGRATTSATIAGAPGTMTAIVDGGAFSSMAALSTRVTFPTNTTITATGLNYANDTKFAANILLTVAAATTQDVRWQTASVNRWLFRKDGTAEGGANAGSNYEIDARADDGTLVKIIATITRSTGAWNWGDAVDISTGATTGSKFPRLNTQKWGAWGATPIVQPTRAGQLTDNSGGASGGNTVAVINPATVDNTAAKLTDTQNAIATLAARLNLVEGKLSAAGGGVGITA